MNFLLAISLGPVQEFIAAARRTADLQAGSTLLVEATKQAARVIQEGRGTGSGLVLPADAEIAGANVLLAEVGGAAPSELAANARGAVEQYLRQQFEVSLRSLSPGAQGAVDGELANHQIGQLLEWFAAWWPRTDDYADDRKQVMRLLAGRKALRDFSQPKSRSGRQKSPLDPSRDCVLNTLANLSVPKPAQEHPLWLKSRETLDAVSLLKRLLGSAGRIGTTPSTSLMALRSQLPLLLEKAPSEMKTLSGLAEQAGAGIDLGDFLFEGRTDDSDFSRLAAKLGRSIDEVKQEIQQTARAAKRAAGLSDLNPYYAILVADGDRMGEALGRLTKEENDPGVHRGLSRALGGFAGEVKEEVGNAKGHLIYCGGDDVLALLPVIEAIPCADRLRQSLVRQLEPLGLAESTPTLSVGIVFAHYNQSLQEALDLARDAERAAKGPRNSLAVTYAPRGGAPVTSVLRWDQGANAEWSSHIAAFGGGLARGVPYELRDLAREFGPATGGGQQPWQQIPTNRGESLLRRECERILARKEGGGPIRVPAWVTDPETLFAWANLLIIARFLGGLKINDLPDLGGRINA